MDDPREGQSHNHDRSDVNIEVARAKANMKVSIQGSTARPGQVVAQALTTVTDACQLELGRDDTMRRTLRRQQRDALPREPASLRDLPRISGPWANTAGLLGRRFLLLDGDSNHANRMLVFSSDAQLEHLAAQTTWFVGGTFQAAPRIFSQILVVRAPLGETAVSCAYAFLRGKTEELYTRVLDSLVQKMRALGLTVSARKVVSDFERGLMNAAVSALGAEVQLQGCFYHLTQSTYRKVQELGLAPSYRIDDNIRHLCGMLDGLAFLPLQMVSDGMTHLRQIFPQEGPMMDLINYFDETYVSGGMRRVPNTQLATVRLRRVRPIYPPAVWNVFEATMNGEPRTNNFCEGWNNGFRSLAGLPHPSVWTAIKAIQMDEGYAYRAIRLNALADLPLRRRSAQTENMQRRLQALCRRLSDGTIELSHFLRAVGHNIRHHSQNPDVQPVAEVEGELRDIQPVAEVEYELPDIQPVAEVDGELRDIQPVAEVEVELADNQAGIELGATGQRCPICLEALGQRPVVALVSCGHCFCQACTYQILTQPDNRCPVCRSDIVSSVMLHYA